MNILRWTRKVVTSVIGGFAATTDSPGTPAGRKLDPSEKFTRTTPVCSFCLKQFKEHLGGVPAVPGEEHDIIQLHAQHCPANPLVQKLEAAAHALKQIARVTKNNPAIPQKYCQAIHKTASDGYEAAKP